MALPSFAKASEGRAIRCIFFPPEISVHLITVKYSTTYGKKDAATIPNATIKDQQETSNGQ